MNTTSVSLLERLRQPAAQEAWSRFVQLYSPLLYYWARRIGLQAQDASDLVQDVFTVLIQKLPEFNYDQHKSFRGWLRTVTLNKWRDRLKRQATVPVGNQDAALADVADPDSTDAFAEAEYREQVIRHALRVMQTDFEPATWQACWAYVVESRPPADVARELGLTINAVYLAKSRVLSRLREELRGLLD